VTTMTTGSGPGRISRAELEALRAAHTADRIRHERRLAAIRADHTRPRPAVPPEPAACAGGCGRPVTVSDWAVHGAGRAWHAWCWHVTQAPGQGDLLDLLTLTPNPAPPTAKARGDARC
jgi:hypothetical protein